MQPIPSLPTPWEKNGKSIYPSLPEFDVSPTARAESVQTYAANLKYKRGDRSEEDHPPNPITVTMWQPADSDVMMEAREQVSGIAFPSPPPPAAPVRPGPVSAVCSAPANKGPGKSLEKQRRKQNCKRGGDCAGGGCDWRFGEWLASNSVSACRAGGPTVSQVASSAHRSVRNWARSSRLLTHRISITHPALGKSPKGGICWLEEAVPAFSSPLFCEQSI